MIKPKAEVIQCDSLTECTPECEFYTIPQSPSSGTLTCRLIIKFKRASSPVTKSIYAKILKVRGAIM